MNFKVLWTDFTGWKAIEYFWLILALGFILFLSLKLGSDGLSIISALANVLCVILIAKGRISNYLWGTIGVILYGYMAYQQQYYGNMLLNWCYFLPLQFVGAFLWYKHIDASNLSVNKRHLQWYWRLLLSLILFDLIILVGYALAWHHDAMPIADAFTTLASIVAMLLMLARYAEQWILWIGSNLVSLYMWILPTLHHEVGAAATLGMWCIFLLNSLYGAWVWFKS